MKKLAELVQNRKGAHRRFNLAVANGGSPEEMEKLREQVASLLPGWEHFWDGRSTELSAFTSGTVCWAPPFRFWTDK